MLPQGIITTKEELTSAVEYFLTQDEFYFDIETTTEQRLQPQVAPVTWLSLATNGCAITIPMGHERGEFSHEEKVPTPYKSGKNVGKLYNRTVKVYGDAPKQLDPGTVFEITKPLFASTSIVKGGHDVLFDLVGVSKYLGFVPPGPYDDSKIGFWLLNENDRQGSYLKNMIEARYGFKYDFENTGACVESHPFSLVGYYSYCDAKMGFQCMKHIRQEIEAQGLQKIYNLEMSVLSVMIGMRLAGVRIDVERLMEFREELKTKLVEAEGKIYAAAGHKFSITANRQKADVLYTEQKLKPWKLTKGGLKKQKLGLPITLYDYSVDADVLESYPDNKVAAAMVDYNKIHKVLSTYVESWLGKDDDPPLIIDGYIHAGFQQYGTKTGRFSCRAPNLQNPPRPNTWLGKGIRSLFAAGQGYKFVVADYSQIELVVLAHYIGKGKLYEAFMNNIDPHTMTAAMVLDKEPEEVTKLERQDLGKTLGFAVVYGAGLKKVAAMAKMNIAGARHILKMHEKMFPEIHAFKQAVIDHAKSRRPIPYITTLLGRKRRIKELFSKDDGIRMGAERQIVNSLIQGGAGDLIKLAMVILDAMLPDEASIVLTCHDELVVSCPEHMAEMIAEMMREAMTGEGIQKLINVPLKIDLHICDSWDEAK